MILYYYYLRSISIAVVDAALIARGKFAITSTRPRSGASTLFCN